jgi:hypothetical protein
MFLYYSFRCLYRLNKSQSGKIFFVIFWKRKSVFTSYRQYENLIIKAKGYEKWSSIKYKRTIVYDTDVSCIHSISQNLVRA